jgi:hypothetical protein
MQIVHCFFLILTKIRNMTIYFIKILQYQIRKNPFNSSEVVSYVHRWKDGENLTEVLHG